MTSTIPYTHTSTILLPSSAPFTPATALATALIILHDFPTVIHLNPIVKAVRCCPASDPPPVDLALLETQFHLPIAPPISPAHPFEQYSITDELPLLFGKTVELVYGAAMRRTKDGLESLVCAPSGVTIAGGWEVSVQRRRRLDLQSQEDEEDLVLMLSETGQIKCAWWLGWYIRWTLVKSHEVMHERFRGVWEQKMGLREQGEGVLKALA